MEMLVLFLVLIAFAVAAPRYGVDSRERSAPLLPYGAATRSIDRSSTEDRRSAPAE